VLQARRPRLSRVRDARSARRYARLLGPVVPRGGEAHGARRRPAAGLPDGDRLGDGRAARVGGGRARRLGDRAARPRHRQRRLRDRREPGRTRGAPHLLGSVVRRRSLRPRGGARLRRRGGDARGRLRPLPDRGGAARLALPARSPHRCLRRPREALPRLSDRHVDARAGRKTPASVGYRWPAEWEPHRATWLSWPHNPETWPESLHAVVESFAAIVRALVPHESVCIGVGDEALEARARAALARSGVDPEGVTFHRCPTNDAWARDHGPIFVVRGDPPGRAVLDFRFDNWGRKYPGWEADDAVPNRVARILGLPRFACDTVLEGGAIDGDGRGSVLTTESCLLNPNRGPERTRERMEGLLADSLGATRVLWLAGGIEGDDTDGHVDDVARFVAPGVVVAAVCEDAADPNRAP